MEHKTDGGFMGKYDKGVKCQKCGYFLKQSKISSVYLEGKILLPFCSGSAKITM
jgi:hypothetical protein